MSKIVIIEYGAGNLFSVRVAIERLGYEVVCSADPRVVREADKVIFPGVGQAAAAMRQLKESGMDRVIPELKVPVLGICLGMQLMCAYSEEGGTEGLGIFPMRVEEFGRCGKVPHMGWNSLHFAHNGKLFQGIEEGAYVYFVHSYYLEAEEESIVKASAEYGVHIHASVEKENVFACQFHPEKSGETGLKILKNFTEL